MRVSMSTAELELVTAAAHRDELAVAAWLGEIGVAAATSGRELLAGGGR